MKRIALALLLASSSVAATSVLAPEDAYAEGRRMLIFSVYDTADSISIAATTTVVDFSTQVACREARYALQRDNNLRAPGFRVFATCVEP